MNTNFYFNTAVFIDAGVDNYQQLFDGVVAEAQPFLLDTARDGIEQIDGILQQYPQVKTVHIISHGSPGCLYLGNSQFTLGTLEHYATELQRWNIDNLLLYGCNVAAGDPGAEFVAKLRGLTGADIAASATLTGAAIKGGNWELEVRTGEMSSSLGLELEVMGSYPGVLNGDFTDSGQSLDNSTNGCDISLADVDGDGDLDAFVANVSEPNKVWKNDG
ncbi:DUF4347 domain-containing protein, partial [Dapis sp. BLCC M172]|uniref:DUF4347 domain-containing protein n=1 Tax=Dapis sp. BLCC M172 TaxID=2975281 RepID=UPI003CF57BBD